MTARRLLFVCVENSCRSQMAEAFARIHGAGRCEPRSAGSKPSGSVNSEAVRAMRELGYDLSEHRSESVDDLPDVLFDVVVTMGCGDACPAVRAKESVDWQIPDPKQMGRDEFREIRDRIGERVRALVEQLQ